MNTTYTATKPLVGPASDKQIAYLEALLVKVPLSSIAPLFGFAKASGALTKDQASKWISILIPEAAKAKTVTVAIETPKPVAPAVEIPVPAQGYFLVDDQAFYFAEKKSPYGGKTLKLMKLYKKQVYVPGHTDTDGQWVEGTYMLKGSWKGIGGTYQAKKLLAGLDPMTKDEAGALGKKYGFCIRCGAFLTDPVSVANGIGPICAGYWM